MALRVQQDIAIMSILNLQDVAEQRVTSHGLHEVHLGLLITMLALATTIPYHGPVTGVLTLLGRIISQLLLAGVTRLLNALVSLLLSSQALHLELIRT